MEHSSRALSAAGALFFEEAGRVLLVKPTYKPNWEIPGGVVEHGETPRDGDDRILFVFEGGTITNAAEIRLQAEELRSYEFVTPQEAQRRLIPRPARRVEQALRAQESGETHYLEHGRQA